MNCVPLLITSGFAALALAQSPDPLAPRPNGMQPSAPTRHLIKDAIVHTSPGSMIENADVLIDNGMIVAVGSDLEPGSATIWSIDGAHVYAGFIDPYIEVDAPMPSENSAGQHWSNKVTPQRDALNIGLPADISDSLREMGFTTAMIAPDSGIFRGWSAIVSAATDFSDDSMGDPPIYQAQAAQMMGFDRGGWGDPGYPTSHMGVVALMRQTFSDANHRASGTHADTSCLDHVDPSAAPLFYETNHELEALLANNIASEFGHSNIVLIDNGTAHRRLNAFKEMGYPIIVPLNYPTTPDVFSIGAADSVDLPTLQHYERAPANARWLSNSGLTVALTTSKDGKSDFWKNLHIAIEKGLEPESALAMITTNPAKILGLNNQGSIEANNIANLVVASGDLFDPESDAKIIDTWIDGRRHHINDEKNSGFEGRWDITIDGAPMSIAMEIEGKSLTISHHIPSSSDDEEAQDIDTKATKVEIDHNRLSFVIDYEDDAVGAYISSITLLPDGTLQGASFSPSNDLIQWSAVPAAPIVTVSDFKGTWNATLADQFKLDFKVSKDSVTIIEKVDGSDDIEQEATNVRIDGQLLAFEFEHEPFGMAGTFTIGLNAPSDEIEEGNAITGIGTLPSGKAFSIAASKESKDDDSDKVMLADLPESPFGAFVYDQAPTQDSYMLTGATVWTQSDEGVLEDAWVMVRDGKISSMGTGGWPEIFVDHTIDASGMHITPGLIDAHSHTGLFRFGVNESGQAVTSEVRISDSLDPGHPGFYRELAGGLTTANLLHGSANPIGGQSKTIKLRWNSAKPSDMFFEDAKAGIKFALGENVKQSNWGDDRTSRYPQTRLGVETLFRDRFTKAREYANRGMKTESGYRDLELETLAQILAGDRLIHCHSYRQDEILMLCRIAEEFGFKIGTFQHGLETYKVAEIVREHAIGASIFSDWWAYKVEVQDAIPFAGPINHEAGLLTSYNSDSDDVARRMHVEAGKALKYAKLSGIDMSEQQALNFVTLNPAIQLGIDDRVGSLEPGKDADIVIWTGHPLSSLSRPEMTFVDGRLLFSRDMDQALQRKNNSERERLIQLVINGGKPPKTKADHDDHDHDHTHDINAQHDHSNTDRGDCGCSQLLPAWNTDY